MESIGDPLLALRDAIKSKTPITYLTDGQPAPTLLAATHLSLSTSISLPKSSPTRYTKPGVSNPSSAADVYTLEAVYLAWLLRDAPGAEYMRQAREGGLTVGFVSVTERKSIVEWLEGKVADLERIRPLANGKLSSRALVYGLISHLCFEQSRRRRLVRRHVGLGPRPHIRLTHMALTPRRRANDGMSLTLKIWRSSSE